MMNRQNLRHYLQIPLTIVLALAVISIFMSIDSFTNSSIQDDDAKQIQNLRSRIDDLKRIKHSVSLELRQIERDRSKLLKEKSNLLAKNEKLINQISNSKLHLKQLELDLTANRNQRSDQLCASDRIAPIIFNPLKSIDLKDYSISRHDSGPSNPAGLNEGSIQNKSYLLDYSSCPLSRNFGFSMQTISSQSQNLIEPLLESHDDLVPIEQACISVFILGSTNILEKFKIDTRNNVIFNLVMELRGNLSMLFDHDSAIVISPYFPRGSYRDRIDIVIPSILAPAESFDALIGSMPPQSPLERKYFATYFGQAKRTKDTTYDQRNQDLSFLERILQTLHRSSIEESFLFNYYCGPLINQQCYEQRTTIIGKSIFLIILPSKKFEIDINANELIYSALLRGTIPVIIGKGEIRLPFDEVIDWRRASIILPAARLPELNFILKSLGPADLYSLKYHGRRIFETYLATSKQVVDTVINIVRIERFGHPPPMITDFKASTYFKSNQLTIDLNCSTISCNEAKSDSVMNLLSLETLGPKEHPLASPSFRRNYSLLLNSAYDLWNNPMCSSKYLFPSLPGDPVAPSEFKFIASDQGYRPIAHGQGGSGVEFSQSLGGDYPNEQFTIVLLTYERKVLLMRTLERLKGMAYLNKVIVVWNGINQKPSIDMIWPNIGVPIEIVRVEQNSLNNRFLPFDLIETDAIFSMDDDSPLRPDEIVFAFRVWRQSRDRIVGFPGRFHAWDRTQNAWLYNSNHSCELSMVLTGGAFFHKYYTYMYSYFMPESIRSIVDKFMNCEDIAMNFLVAHLTRKPPIKVTSRWTFHCANCLSSLSEDDSHFRERHECLNIFASIYGYMPLLNTQHRSDSILFKTRLPKDKQKCFKFV